MFDDAEAFVIEKPLGSIWLSVRIAAALGRWVFKPMLGIIIGVTPVILASVALVLAVERGNLLLGYGMLGVLIAITILLERVT